MPRTHAFPNVDPRAKGPPPPIALTPGSEIAAEDVQPYVRERVAAYKYPRVGWITGELPMGATGRILEREIQIPHA